MRRAPVLAGAVLLAGLVAVLVLLAGGGDKSDEQAIRDWFAGPSGGGAPAAALSSIHVAEPCLLTEAMSGRRQVLRCPITTDAPDTPKLHTCFVIVGGTVLRGGWQLAKLDACNALRFDPRTGTLLDVAARQHYRVTA